jgi:hypothetical protein
MPYQIKIIQVTEVETDAVVPEQRSVDLFSATVDEIDMLAISNMVYRPKRRPRADIGKPRAAK